MTYRPRLRLTLPPLSPREALTLSSIFSTIDDVLWAHYAEAMVELLNEEPFVPGPWWSTDRDRDQSNPAPLGRIPRGMRPTRVLPRDKEVEHGDVKKRGR